MSLSDSLYTQGKGDVAEKLLSRFREEIDSSDPRLASYYMQVCLVKEPAPAAFEAYADSAMSLFISNKSREKFPQEYRQALMLKGDASLAAQKYHLAIDYFAAARKVAGTQNCQSGLVSSRLAGIYFGQKNYLMAARRWAESARQLNLCAGDMEPKKLFYQLQGALNNAGYAYMLAGRQDSALHFFQADSQCIARAVKNPAIGEPFTRAARIVLFDNLAGLYIAKGNFEQAAAYLRQCLAVPLVVYDGILAPPLLKQAEVAMHNRDLQAADDAFTKSSKHLVTFPDGSLRGTQKWHLLRSRYYLLAGQPVKAYEHLQTHLRLKDSIDNASAALFRLDVNRELQAVQQQKALAEFKQQDKLEKLYLAGIIVVVCFSGAVILLITGNLRSIRKNQRITARHNAELQESLSELERANQNYIRIMRVMAHDLRNPLSGITGLANLLLMDDSLNKDSRHMVGLIESSSRNSTEMINELLSTGLSQSSEPMQTAPVNMVELMNNTLELIRFRAAEKEQRLEFDAPALPINVRINREKIWRVLNNLLVNAIKFSHAGGIIRLAVSTHHKEAIVAVKDNGIGIPAEFRDRVFDMFTEAKRAGTSGEQPFGLGLSISKNIVDKHGGRIWFESEPGLGTTFFLALPLDQGAG
ncbi:sensor histidine kinase [Pedobacter yulinensis]|uniref:sensor histidine kinase n=1 Tax=Pedobacter yulinensis TaxID=2126353 RepID=UPI0013A5F98B|nr:HAMP domain-containing sensor histidine kinase [Pedobacter yulinensis]